MASNRDVNEGTITALLAVYKQRMQMFPQSALISRNRLQWYVHNFAMSIICSP